MKKIGLVGGTGPESTLMYYKELNTRIDNLTGGIAMPDIAIESVNFERHGNTCHREIMKNYQIILQIKLIHLRFQGQKL